MEISKKVQERRLKWNGRVMRREKECLGKQGMSLSYEDGCGWEKEMKTEAEMDGQCNCGLEGERIVGKGKTGLCGGNLSETSTPT